MTSRNANRIMGGALAIALPWFASIADGAERPNILFVIADDLGYGDLGCYGSQDIATPHIDRLAREGVRFTDFHSAQPVCSASRAAFLTGCYPNRIGIHGALGPQARHGIHADETTLGELFRLQGYATCAIGKWHLGHHLEFLPTRHGFDHYFGLPYSNDMWPHHPERAATYPPLPLFSDEVIIDVDVTPADQDTLTERYTAEAVKFIDAHHDQPFFLYFAHTFPHVPLHVGKRFRGSSRQGLFGDVVQEVDWSVGELLAALERHGLAERTLVVFTSDNGPWLRYGNHAGSAGPLREGKGTTYEGGIRVPFLARWPGHIPAGAEQREVAMAIDVLPTLARLVGAEPPPRPVDGMDIWPLFACEPGAVNPHDAYYFYYASNELQAVRSGDWKLILPHKVWQVTSGHEVGRDGVPAKSYCEDVGYELYNLKSDIGELNNLAAERADVVERLKQYAERARASLGDALTDRTGGETRSPGQSAE